MVYKCFSFYYDSYCFDTFVHMFDLKFKNIYQFLSVLDFV